MNIPSYSTIPPLFKMVFPPTNSFPFVTFERSLSAGNRYTYYIRPNFQYNITIMLVKHTLILLSLATTTSTGVITIVPSAKSIVVKICHGNYSSKVSIHRTLILIKAHVLMPGGVASNINYQFNSYSNHAEALSGTY